MCNIQKARDVLAKWRDETLVGGVHRTDLPLVVGTAGNPDLLDAIDALLALAIEYGDLAPGNGSRFIDHAERIAAAIIAADEQMNA